MQTPHTADAFIDYMAWVWENAPTSTYAEEHNARITARKFGAVKRWAHKVNGESGFRYDMPDGSGIGITTRGSAVTLIRGHID